MYSQEILAETANEVREKHEQAEPQTLHMGRPRNRMNTLMTLAGAMSVPGALEPLGDWTKMATMFGSFSKKADEYHSSKQLIYKAEAMEHCWADDVHEGAILLPMHVGYATMLSEARPIVEDDIRKGRVAPTPRWMAGWYDLPYIYPRFGFMPEVYQQLTKQLRPEWETATTLLMNMITELEMAPELKAHLSIDRGPVPWTKVSVRSGWEPCLWQGEYETTEGLMDIYVQYGILLTKYRSTKISQIRQHSHVWNKMARHPSTFNLSELHTMWFLGGKYAKRVLVSR